MTNDVCIDIQLQHALHNDGYFATFQIGYIDIKLFASGFIGLNQ